MNENQNMLIVEDSDEDYYIIERAFKKAGITNNMHRCVDGQDALDYCYHREKYASKIAPKPNIILLDLNLPKISGLDVLRTVKNDPVLRSIPVIILTTSVYEKDIKACYHHGANSYIQKPMEFNKLVEIARILKHYWIDTVILPKCEITI